MQTIEVLNGTRSRLLDIKKRTTELDDITKRSLATIEEIYLKSESDEPGDAGPDVGDYSETEYDADGDMTAAAGGGQA